MRGLRRRRGTCACGRAGRHLGQREPGDGEGGGHGRRAGRGSRGGGRVQGQVGTAAHGRCAAGRPGRAQGRGGAATEAARGDCRAADPAGLRAGDGQPPDPRHAPPGHVHNRDAGQLADPVRADHGGARRAGAGLLCRRAPGLAAGCAGHEQPRGGGHGGGLPLLGRGHLRAGPAAAGHGQRLFRGCRGDRDADPGGALDGGAGQGPDLGRDPAAGGPRAEDGARPARRRDGRDRPGRGGRRRRAGGAPGRAPAGGR